jgi:phosphate transport system substrate-binding protein
MTLSMKAIRLAAAGIAAAGFVSAASAAEISGAGATFPYPIYAKWADAYKQISGNSLNYQSIGSGGGIKQISANTVTFGASDKPLKPEELDKAGLAQFPTVMGGVVPVVNLSGINPGDLVLDGSTLADIYLGKITQWDDAAIKKLNPSLPLPSQAIAIVHRSDGSGTSFIFTNYLSKMSKEWADQVGSNTSVQWPAGIGAKGNEGVAANVAQTAGSIGYVEYAYAKQNKLTFTKMINHDGQTVAPTADAFTAAASGADWTSAKGFYMILTDQPGAQSWPITAATFILMQRRPSDQAASIEALKFFDWAYANGDQMAVDLDYIPMPDNVVKLIHDYWKESIKGSTGTPIYSGGM